MAEYNLQTFKQMDIRCISHRICLGISDKKMNLCSVQVTEFAYVFQINKSLVKKSQNLALYVITKQPETSQKILKIKPYFKKLFCTCFLFVQLLLIKQELIVYKKTLHSNFPYIAKQLLNKLTNQKRFFITLIHF